MALRYLGRFWYCIPLLALAIYALWLRGSLANAKSDARAAKVQVEAVTDANASLKRALDMAAQQRADNDKIAAAVAAQLAGNLKSENVTRTIIERQAQNDPVVRDWGAGVVPDSVRETLRTGAVDAGAGRRP